MINEKTLSFVLLVFCVWLGLSVAKEVVGMWQDIKYSKGVTSLYHSSTGAVIYVHKYGRDRVIGQLLGENGAPLYLDDNEWAVLFDKETGIK